MNKPISPLTSPHLYLHDSITNNVIASTPAYGLSLLDGTKWEWIAASLASWHGCRMSEVDCVETDDGDRYTVRGEVVARLERN